MNTDVLIPQFHHLGLLTGDPVNASKTLAAFGYTMSEPVSDPLQQVDLIMAVNRATGFNVEIIHPHKDNTGLRSLAKRKSDYMYHACYTTPDIGVMLEQLQRLGIQVSEVSAPKAAVMFGGTAVAFYLFEGIGLVEFLERKPGA